MLNTDCREARQSVARAENRPLSFGQTFPFSLIFLLMAVADFSGKEGALQIFRKSLLKDRLAHAYLISGGDITALNDFAILLAKILNCETPLQRAPSGVGLDFCGQCRVCRQIDASQQADVSWVRPVSKSRMITIGQIRAVEDAVHLKAHSLPFKVIIVSGADGMNVPAQNAFLKTLEEPPARSVILLLSTEPKRLLDTIVSRCLRMRLGREAADKDDQKQLVDLRERIRKDEIWLDEKKSEIEKNLEDASPRKASDGLDPKRRKRSEQEQQKLKTVKWLVGLCGRIRNVKTSAHADSSIFLSDQELKVKASIWLVGLCGRIRNVKTSANADFPIFLSDQELVAVMWLVGLCEEGRRKGARFKIIGDLCDLLNDRKLEIKKTLAAASPLAAFDDLEPHLRKRYKQELDAAIEAEYRRQRADLLSILQWFLRDVWLHTLRADGALLRFPEIAQESRRIADRISPAEALENIEIVEKSSWLLQNTNVQEVLALEVALRKISL